MEIIEIPNKSAFKLNEVCSITGVKPYVLRFWESEFEEIEPMTSSTGQKLFGPRDIEAIATVKDLLFNQKMSIDQARFSLKKALEVKHTDVDSSEVDMDMDSEELSEEVHHESENNGLSFQRMNLSDVDLEKLVLAKTLLKDIVDHRVMN